MMQPARKKYIHRLAWLLPLLLAGGIYFAVNPEISGWMPKCVFKVITGLDCPGCGSQRMLHSLLHGDLAAAWSYNPFLVCMIPVVAMYAAVEFFPLRFPRLFRILHSPGVIIGIGIAIILWGIMRNIF